MQMGPRHGGTPPLYARRPQKYKEPLRQKPRRSWASAAKPPRHVPKASPQRLALRALASLTRAPRGPGGYCRTSGYRGTTVRLLVSSFGPGPSGRWG